MNERMREKQKSSITQGCVEVVKSDYIDHISAAVSETFRKTCITHHTVVKQWVNHSLFPVCQSSKLTDVDNYLDTLRNSLVCSVDYTMQGWPILCSLSNCISRKGH